jgi:uroporphyrinogen-III decarboxylase
MGFEGAMIAMMEEPEAVYELLTAITDYKIALAKKVAKYYRADTFTHVDDIATERSLFMSPETYRQLIKPQHTRLNKAVRDLGMIPIQHTCGHAEICVEDYIETGADAWNMVQTSNDIVSLLDKYGNKFCFEGGFDMNGRPQPPGSDGGRCYCRSGALFPGLRRQERLYLRRSATSG